MDRSAVLVCVFCLALASTSLVEAGLGVNWGTLCSHPMHPRIVVDLLKANGINKVKLFDADSWALRFLAGSGIETMLAVPNEMLSLLVDYGKAEAWVKHNVTKHMRSGGVDIRYVAVGNEPFLTTYNGSFIKSTLPAMKNIQKALDEAGFSDKIKVTVPMNADVYSSKNAIPSTGDWRNDVRKPMTDIVKFLQSTKAPFVVNMYPYLSLYLSKDFPVDFAFFDGGGKPTTDKNVQYYNVFDASYDTLIWALKKSGAADMKIIVGEVGWPTDAVPYASIALAHRFYRGLLKKMVERKGTPLRSEMPDVYLFSLFDEDMKSIAPGNFERHWGVFTFDGKPKFQMDLALKGREKWPVAAQGVQYMEKQWCVLDKDAGKNMSLGPRNIDYACSLADCTSLGWSCKLDLLGEYSYAFNMYFQMHDQDVEACVFDGLAKITDTNASTGGCLFPIQLMSGAQRLNVVSVTNVMFLLSIFVAFM